MPIWILICPECKSEFEHSQISDVGMASLLLPEKPSFEPTGNKCVCPSCGTSATYHRTDLLYRDYPLLRFEWLKRAINKRR